MIEDDSGFLKPPNNGDFPPLTRLQSVYNPLHTFDLPKGEQKHYTQQYADMYFLRLAMLKPTVEQIAAEAWDGFQLAGEKAKRVDRVLDVRQGELSWVIGTVYMDMPLKPNVLDDLSKEHWIAAPPQREKYLSPTGGDAVMLEDESGRLRLTGIQLQSFLLVTGCIIAVMGTENADGAFEIVDIRIPDLPRQPERWERDESAIALAGGKVKAERARSGKIAIVSGLEMGSDSDDPMTTELLVEYLLGEASSAKQASRISRLVIAGNSLLHSSPIAPRDDVVDRKSHKKFGYDSSTYNPVPSEHLDQLLATLLPSLPITLLPGASDPAPVSLPQQPLHPALFPHSRSYANLPTQTDSEPSWLDSVTNPWEGDIDGWRFLGTAGQPVDDMFKYLPGDDRLEMMEHLLRWRNCAPTAPDTLWSYPFQDEDPFIIHECPHVYFAGNQPRFETTTIEGPAGQVVRMIMVPKFRESGTLVLLDAETLDVECVRIELYEK